MSIFIIAEAGVNHNGDLGLAMQLVDIAAKAGADAVKFQTFSAERLALKGTAKASYQKRTTGEGDQFSMLKALELESEDYHRLKQKCDDLNIEFMSTGFDEESLDFLLELGLKRIKIPSGEITNMPLIKHAAKADLPLIVSTGMANLEEVVEAISWIDEARTEAGISATPSNEVSILHCTSNYPASPESINLRAMQTLAETTGKMVGYSDHSVGNVISIAAVAMGAQIIEKHYTLDKKLPGPDHEASLEPAELEDLIRAVRDTETALGNGVKAPNETELPVREIVRKSIVAARPIQKGQKIVSEDLIMVRPGTGIPPKFVDSILGKTATREVSPATILSWEDLQ